MAKTFITNCLYLLGENPLFWIAFQSNVLCDVAATSTEFKRQFNAMITQLRTECKFYLPKLNVNMRNSFEVGEVANNIVAGSRSGNKITNIIETLSTHKSSISSNKPKLFPILADDINKHLESIYYIKDYIIL